MIAAKNIWIILLILAGTSCHITRPAVKTYAFIVDQPRVKNIPDYTKTIEAPISVKSDTFLFVYIETAEKGIGWDTAWQRTLKFACSIIPLGNESFTVGNLKGSSTYIITPAQGSQLYQLQLIPIHREGFIFNDLTTEPLLLTGTYKGKKFKIKTGRLIEILALPGL